MKYKYGPDCIKDNQMRVCTPITNEYMVSKILLACTEDIFKEAYTIFELSYIIDRQSFKYSELSKVLSDRKPDFIDTMDTMLKP